MTATARKTAGALLGIHAQTGLHPGAGTALGTVDMPVQRERHTHWPTIAGSALKGVLRDAYREQVLAEYQEDGPEVPDRDRRSRRRVANEENAQLTALFGPGKVDESSAHAGALSVTDARLLAFPVRSLKGVFAWVTCRMVLERLRRDAALAGLAVSWAPFDVPGSGASLPTPRTSSAFLIDGEHLVLEEFEFTTTDRLCGDVAGWIAGNLLPSEGAYEGTRERFQRSLLVLNDDDFSHFARHATEVTARIGLNYDTKTVRKGALFYQEFLPAETLLYSVVLANAARTKNGNGKSEADMLGQLRDLLGKTPVLQIGGDETIGKGLCGIRMS